jgi:hypothetical protein
MVISRVALVLVNIYLNVLPPPINHKFNAQNITALFVFIKCDNWRTMDGSIHKQYLTAVLSNIATHPSKAQIDVKVIL